MAIVMVDGVARKVGTENIVFRKNVEIAVDNDNDPPFKPCNRCTDPMECASWNACFNQSDRA